MKPGRKQKRRVGEDHPLYKNTMVLVGDIRWLLSQENCPSYPLILTVFAGIECLANMIFSNQKPSQNAQDFIDTYMENYHHKLDCGILLSKALYENLRSATSHHGGPRGGVVVSHEKTFIDDHLKIRDCMGKKCLVVQSRCLAQNFLDAAQRILEQNSKQDMTCLSISSEELEKRYTNVAVTSASAYGYQGQDIYAYGTSVMSTM